MLLPVPDVTKNEGLTQFFKKLNSKRNPLFTINTNSTIVTESGIYIQNR